jgi:hypothetical protein
MNRRDALRAEPDFESGASTPTTTDGRSAISRSRSARRRRISRGSSRTTST